MEDLKILTHFIKRWKEFQFQKQKTRFESNKTQIQKLKENSINSKFQNISQQFLSLSNTEKIQKTTLFIEEIKELLDEFEQRISFTENSFLDLFIFFSNLPDPAPIISQFLQNYNSKEKTENSQTKNKPQEKHSDSFKILKANKKINELEKEVAELKKLNQQTNPEKDINPNLQEENQSLLSKINELQKQKEAKDHVIQDLKRQISSKFKAKSLHKLKPSFSFQPGLSLLNQLPNKSFDISTKKPTKEKSLNLDNYSQNENQLNLISQQIQSLEIENSKFQLKLISKQKEIDKILEEKNNLLQELSQLSKQNKELESKANQQEKIPVISTTKQNEIKQSDQNYNFLDQFPNDPFLPREKDQMSPKKVQKLQEIVQNLLSENKKFRNENETIKKENLQIKEEIFNLNEQVRLLQRFKEIRSQIEDSGVIPYSNDIVLQNRDFEFGNNSVSNFSNLNHLDIKSQQNRDSLNFIDRTTLKICQIGLSNQFSRSFLFFYIVIIHLLIFYLFLFC
ncbi:a-type inclusion protein [Anaeramoeba ignava]|uniref:A-type inclusion protein n=1 Tax=Anaeramoeba ignava TaxID=1746090 RepID=A0A9Q0LKA8_ANAIG|nr:a-type inclusion protein [Anaeramoeba ignava]